MVPATVFAMSLQELPEPQVPTYIPDIEWETPTTTQAHEEIDINSDEYIRQEILKVFPDAPIMVEVARCESELNPLADRAGRNVDVGLFQLNQVHLPRLRELGLDRRVLQDNLTFARMLYDESGLNPWYMSKHCWEHYL